jgi:hypothetical protein
VPSRHIGSKPVIKALNTTARIEYFVNALVWMLHGPQYRASIDAQEGIKTAVKDHRVHQALENWPSIFTGHTWIVNRTTPPHRDKGGFNGGFDFLSVGGTAKALMRVRDINVSCEYNPGTVVAIAGRVLSHEVCQVEDGDRIAVARWVRRAVLLKYGMNTRSCEDQEQMSEVGSKDQNGEGDVKDMGWSTLGDFCERMAGCLLHPLGVA